MKYSLIMFALILGCSGKPPAAEIPDEVLTAPTPPPPVEVDTRSDEWEMQAPVPTPTPKPSKKKPAKYLPPKQDRGS